MWFAGVRKQTTDSGMYVSSSLGTVVVTAIKGLV